MPFHVTITWAVCRMSRVNSWRFFLTRTTKINKNYKIIGVLNYSHTMAKKK